MYVPAISPIALPIVPVLIFLSFYFIGIRPWRRRKKKKVSLLVQLKFAYIWVFIIAGILIIPGLFNLLFNNKRVSIFSIAIGIGLVALGVFVMQKSMHALIFSIGAIVLHIIISLTIQYNYVGSIFGTNSGYLYEYIVFVTLFSIIIFETMFTPLVRGILAIRDLKREEN
jgi:hypothetical protein